VNEIQLILVAAGGLAAGFALGAAWRALRDRGRIAALEQRLASEQAFADERRLQAERTDALLSQLAAVNDSHRTLNAQARHLVDTLRSPVVRGQWGEMQLRRVCELAQMSEHVDFFLQDAAGSGSLLRPDLRVELPGGRSIVVDAKSPMQAFLDATESSDDVERTALLQRHARQVREHIARLGAKSYWEQFDGSPDFVVLFLPGEALFSSALQYDASLIEFGVGQRVMLASPTTLIALLRAAAHGWQRARATENADAIREAGALLHDDVAAFTRHLQQVRSGLERATEGYNRAVSAVERRVIPHAHRLRELGAHGPRPVVVPRVVDGRAVGAADDSGPDLARG
jgi:DNA recombination protein RmuC